MLVGEIVDLAIIKASGGVLSPDIAITRLDALAYMPAAINFAIKEQYYLEQRIRRDYESLPTDFIATYPDVAVETDSARNVRYSKLPARVISLPKNLGLSLVSDMHGNHEFILLRNQFELSGYDRYTGNTVFIWLEGDKIFYKNLPRVVSKVLVRLMANTSSLSLGDEAPIPGGLEAKVVDLLSEFLTGQRQLSGESIVNSKEDKAQ